MRRKIGLTGLVAGVSAVALVVAGPALADRGRGGDDGGGKKRGKKIMKLEGRIAGTPTSTITVKKRNGKTLTCAVGSSIVPDWAKDGAQARLRCSRSSEPAMISVDPIGRSVPAARVGEAEVRGAISALTQPTAAADGSVTVTAGTSSFSCVIPKGSSIAASFALNDLVEIECWLADGQWTLVRVDKEDDDDDDERRDEAESKGTITVLTQPTAAAAGSITVKVGDSTVTCVVPAGTTIAASFAVGQLVEIKCRRVADVWTLVRIEHEDDDNDDDDEVERKGTISALTAPTADAAGSVTVGDTTCVVAKGSTALAGFSVGQLVEITCDRSGTEWVLRKIEAEDSDDDDDDDHRGRGGRHDD